MRDSINIILPTIRFLPATRDLIRNLIAAVEDLQGVHLTIADGQGDEQKKRWILSKTGEIASQGNFTYIEARDITERGWRALQRETEWIFSVADDDTISINLIRAMYEAVQAAAPDIAAIAPYAYMHYNNNNAFLCKVADMTGETQQQRVTALLNQSHIVGSLMWSAIRREYYLDWVKFIRAKQVAPTYLDQVLVAYLTVRGKVTACKEVCLYAKDNQVWCEIKSSVLKDASCYPDKSATLIHEVLMVADLYAFLTAHGLEDDALIRLTVWTNSLLIRAAALFDGRCSILGIEQSKERELVRALLYQLAATAKLLADKPINQYHAFYGWVQSVCAVLTAAPREAVHRIPA